MFPEINNNSFLETIYLLRSSEEITLFEMIDKVDEALELDVIDFLKSEYQKESLDYPYKVPEFDSKAAVWGAKIIYFVSHLMVNRTKESQELTSFLPQDELELSPSSILSVDLCLRFLPDLIVQLSLLQSDDPIIYTLNKVLIKWHYSGISYLETTEKLDFELVLSNQCLLQLYVDRVIENKSREYLKSKLEAYILGSMGEYKSEFWKEL
ncbi:MAG: hypothetical protein NXI20_06285 [bacterium]|nr:hypothetical protein [bacterium]